MVKFFEYFDFNNCLYFILECVTWSVCGDIRSTDSVAVTLRAARCTR